MPRISLKCDSGWNFFIAGTAQGHETPCPNCGEAVAIPGRKASGSGPKAPGVIAAEKQAKQKQMVLLVSIGAAVLLVAVVLLVATSGSPKPVDDEAPRTDGKSIIDRPAHQRAQVVNKAGGDPAAVNPGADPNAPVGANRETQIEELKKGIRANVWRLNLAGITTESLRLRNHADAVGALQERMKTWEAKIAETLNALLELGERFNVEPHIQPGDRLVAFAQKEFATMRPADADQALLSPWLRSFRAGMPLEQLVILRGAQRIELYLQFPEGSEDLQGIARLPDITGPGRYDEPAPGTLLVQSPVPLLAGPIADSVFKDIEARFGAIPAGYRSMLSPVERGRLETLAKAKTGSADDQQFLNQRLLGELLPMFEREAALVRAKADELQTKLSQTTAVDIVHFKDGRKVTGQVLSQNATEVKVKAKLGSITVLMSDVARIELGKGLGVEFPGKLAATARTPEGLGGLFSWCQTNGLKLEAEYTAALLLTVDPLHDAARKLSGLPARPATKSSGSAPAPSGTLGAPPSAADQVSRTVDLLATDVVKRYPAFGDVLAQMRSGSSGMVFASAPVPPPRSVRAASMIKDPLSFELSQLDASGALEIGQWWGSLPLEDRREFARFFGLWCARERHARGGR